MDGDNLFSQRTLELFEYTIIIPDRKSVRIESTATKSLSTFYSLFKPQKYIMLRNNIKVLYLVFIIKYRGTKKINLTYFSHSRDHSKIQK